MADQVDADDTAAEERRRRLRIAFVHPDLGIGGAERLIVDAAVGLQSTQHEIVIYTSHHDPAHAFEETRDGTLKVRVHGDLPRPRWLRGFHLPLAILRSLWLATCLLIRHFVFREQFDVFIVDQLSISIPLLRLTGAPIFFYGHYPDLLLSAGREQSWIKRLYRWPLDLLEEWTTCQADMIVANSEFTANVFSKTFGKLVETPVVLYPGIRLESYDKPCDRQDASVQAIINDKMKILSINRFERKKNIALAVEAFAKLKQLHPTGPLQLVIAGGYDHRVLENVEYHQELKELAERRGLSTATYFRQKTAESTIHLTDVDTDVLFVPSFTEAQRKYLMDNSVCLIYTPENEHFGIVPLEAMYQQLPVLAVNSGGPTETVLHNITGWLCESDSEAFAKQLEHCLFRMSPTQRRAMGKRGRELVQSRFSLNSFTEQLNMFMYQLVESPRRVPPPSMVSVLQNFLITVVAIALSLFLTSLYWWGK